MMSGEEEDSRELSVSNSGWTSSLKYISQCTGVNQKGSYPVCCLMTSRTVRMLPSQQRLHWKNSDRVQVDLVTFPSLEHMVYELNQYIVYHIYHRLVFFIHAVVNI